MLAILKKMIDAISQPYIQEEFTIILIIASISVLILLVTYFLFTESSIMTKTLWVHEYIHGDTEDRKCHYHNYDNKKGDFNFKNKSFTDEKDWIGRNILFVLPDKINTMYKKKRKLLKIHFDGYSENAVEYNIKKYPKGWEKRKVSKRRVTNYNGSLILANILAKTDNLTAVQIDNKKENECVITYLFDNGFSNKQKIPRTDFMDAMTGKAFVSTESGNVAMPYNLTFIEQCEAILLK